jgi:hypothetical protein
VKLEAKLEERLSSSFRQLALRFGILPEAARARVTSATSEQLDLLRCCYIRKG